MVMLTPAVEIEVNPANASIPFRRIVLGLAVSVYWRRTSTLSGSVKSMFEPEMPTRRCSVATTRKAINPDAPPVAYSVPVDGNPVLAITENACVIGNGALDPSHWLPLKKLLARPLRVFIAPAFTIIGCDAGVACVASRVLLGESVVC